MVWFRGQGIGWQYVYMEMEGNSRKADYTGFKGDRKDLVFLELNNFAAPGLVGLL